MTTKSITDKIIEIRKYKKLSQKDFACKTMISPSTLSEVESKKINPSSALLVGIANAFDDINIEWLLTGNGEMFKSEESESARMKIIDLIESLSEERQKEILSSIIEKRRIYDIEDFMAQLMQRDML